MRGAPKFGFTLLEVLIALAILSSSLTILMGTVVTSNQQSVYSNKLTRITQLAKSKMIDLEYELMREGTTEGVESRSGDFSEEEIGDVTWEAEIQPVEIPEGVREELMGKVNAQLFGGQESQGSLKGSAAFSAKLPKLMGCIPEMINKIGEKIRRVVLKVEFDFRGERESVVFSQYVVDKSSRKFGLFGTGTDSGAATTPSK